jgi:hypothetical protein
MSWWNPFGWSGGFAEDRPEGIWGAAPAAFRVSSMLGEGSVVENAPSLGAGDAGVSSTPLGDIASDFGTSGAGFAQGGFGAPTGFYEPNRKLSALQSSRPADEPMDLIDGLGVGFAA